MDSESLKSLELGTKDFPYKNLNSPLIEIFNYLPSNYSYSILIKEGTEI